MSMNKTRSLSEAQHRVVERRRQKGREDIAWAASELRKAGWTVLHQYHERGGVLHAMIPRGGDAWPGEVDRQGVYALVTPSRTIMYMGDPDCATSRVWPHAPTIAIHHVIADAHDGKFGSLIGDDPNA